VRHVAESPAPITGLPALTDKTGVEPPMNRSPELRSGFFLLNVPTPQLPSESRL
jgi:hypothetical protein